MPLFANNYANRLELEWLERDIRHGAMGIGARHYHWLYVCNQTTKTKKIAIENQTTAQVYEVGIEILKLFVDTPTLRPYFYSNQHSPIEEPERSRVFAVAEVIADHWENIVVFGTSLDEEARDAWRIYMKDVYNRSPVLREHLQLEGFRYAKNFFSGI